MTATIGARDGDTPPRCFSSFVVILGAQRHDIYKTSVSGAHTVGIIGDPAIVYHQHDMIIKYPTWSSDFAKLTLTQGSDHTADRMEKVL